MTELIHDDTQVEQRRASRFALTMDVHVRAQGAHQIRARLISMSRFGCRVVGAALSRSDDLVWIRIPGLESQASELRWSGQDGVGLAFRYPLHAAVVDRFRRPDAESQTGYKLLRCSTGGFGIKLPC